MPGHDKAGERCRVMIRFAKADIIQPEYDIMVSRVLVTKYSEYFRAAFEHDCFVEAQTGVVVLDESDRLPCTRFVWWIYREAGFRNMNVLGAKGERAPEDFQPSDSDKTMVNPAFHVFYILTQCLIFAEVRQAPGFHNWAMGTLIDGLDTNGLRKLGIARCRVEHIYSNSIKGSLVRKILVDIFISRLNGADSIVYKRLLTEGDPFYQAYGPGFLEDVLLASLNPNQASLCPTVWNRDPYMVKVKNGKGTSM